MWDTHFLPPRTYFVFYVILGYCKRYMDFNLGRHIFKPVDTLHNPVPASPWDQKHLSLSHRLYVRVQNVDTKWSVLLPTFTTTYNWGMTDLHVGVSVVQYKKKPSQIMTCRWHAAVPCWWCKTWSTCSPLFTLLRHDVTANPTPHGELPGNMREGAGRSAAAKWTTCTGVWTEKQKSEINAQRYNGGRK